MSKAIPKLSISKELPIISSVNNKVTALTTNRNRPKVKTVTGSVKIMRMGFTSIFKIDNTKLAPSAAIKLSIYKDSFKKPARAIKRIALIIMPSTHLIGYTSLHVKKTSISGGFSHPPLMVSLIFLLILNRFIALIGVLQAVYPPLILFVFHKV